MSQVFYASLMTETNAFSNLPTTYDSFEAAGLRRGRRAVTGPDDQPLGELAPLFAFARARGLDVIGGLAASASPGAPTQHAAYVRLRDEILERLGAAGPIAAVFLHLHGAMATTECADCEGDLLERVRHAVGPDVPIGVVLDPHAHLTERMVANADILSFMREYPHTDGAERAADVLGVVGRMLDGQVRPVASVHNCRQLGFFPTQDGPMRAFVDSLAAWETRAGIVSVSFVHGFPWGDNPDMGAKTLVYTDGDKDLGARVAAALGQDIWRIRDYAGQATVSIDEALALAKRPRSGPLVLADTADNPGGGAPSDSTFLLRAVLDAGLTSVAIALICDPELVRTCHQIGVGGRLEARIGGKTGRSSGPPVDLEIEIMGLERAAEMAVLDLARFALGDTAWVRGAGVDVVLSSLRVQAYSPSAFAHLGLDPMQRSVLIVKSSNHFRAAFSAIAEDIAVVMTPGALDFDFARLPYQTFDKPYYPLVADPFARSGGRTELKPFGERA